MSTPGRDVLSVPAGDTAELIEKFGIYSCPTSYSHEQTLYMAFRRKGGVMDNIYRIEAVETINPLTETLDDFAERQRDRVREYITALAEVAPLTSEHLRFYVLSQSDPIPLPHEPMMKPNPQSHCYLRMDDLKSGVPIVKSVPARP